MVSGRSPWEMAGNESLRSGLPVKVADLGLGVDLTEAEPPRSQSFSQECPGLVLHGSVEDVARWVMLR